MTNIIKLSIAGALFLATTNTLADEDLGMITVSSATKSEQSIQDITSNVKIITGTELEEKHIATVSQALKNIAGINFTSNGGVGSTNSIFVRGFTNQRVLVLIDGIRYNNVTSSSGAQFSHLMANDISKIEVIKGAQSGVWGADATAGVINIITKQAQKGFHGSVNIEYGSFDTKKSMLSVSNKTDKYNVKLTSSIVKTDGFTSQLPNGGDIDDFEDDGYENKTSTLKFGYNIDELNKVDILHTQIRTESNYDGGAWGTTPIQQANSSEYKASTKDKFSSINFNHIDSFNEVDLYLKRSEFEKDDDKYGQYNGTVNEMGLKSKIDYRQNDFVLVGVDKKTFEHEETISKEYSNKSIFLTNSNIFDGLSGGTTIFTQSLRKDTFDQFDNKLTGKIGLKHHHSSIDDFTTSMNYGTAYNAPTLYHLYDTTYGNSDLNPENIKSFDISMKYKNVTITYFKNEIKDMIEYFDPDGWRNPQPGKFYNVVGTSVLKGYELEYDRQIDENTLFNVNYTRLDAKNSSGEYLKRRAKETLNFGVDYYGFKNIHVNINGQYTGDQYDKDDKKGVQTGRHTVFNLVTNYDWNKDNSSFIKIDNITDKEYQRVNGYATSPRAFYIGHKIVF